VKVNIILFAPYLRFLHNRAIACHDESWQCGNFFLFIGISCAAMSQLVSNLNIVKSLCLRQTSLTDDALCNFVGSSLEYLDISETVV
jgi:hypothetical protein